MRESYALTALLKYFDNTPQLKSGPAKTGATRLLATAFGGPLFSIAFLLVLTHQPAQNRECTANRMVCTMPHTFRMAQGM